MFSRKFCLYFFFNGALGRIVYLDYKQSKIVKTGYFISGFRPIFFVTSRRDATKLWKSAGFSAFCQKIGWLIMLSYILLCLLACVRIYIYAICNNFRAHMRHSGRVPFRWTRIHQCLKLEWSLPEWLTAARTCHSVLFHYQV